MADKCKHEYKLITTIKKEIFKKNIFFQSKSSWEKIILKCEKCDDVKEIGF